MTCITSVLLMSSICMSLLPFPYSPFLYTPFYTPSLSILPTAQSPFLYSTFSFSTFLYSPFHYPPFHTPLSISPFPISPLSTLPVAWVHSEFGGSAVVHLTVGRGTGVRANLLPYRNLGILSSPHCLCLSAETLRAVVPFRPGVCVRESKTCHTWTRKNLSCGKHFFMFW